MKARNKSSLDEETHHELSGLMDLAAAENGGTIVMATSNDSAHPPENVIDGSNSTFWSTTGLFPQEIVVELPEVSSLSLAHVVGTNRMQLLLVLFVLYHATHIWTLSDTRWMFCC